MTRFPRKFSSSGRGERPCRDFCRRFRAFLLPISLACALACGSSAPKPFVPPLPMDPKYGVLHQVGQGETLSLVARSYQRDIELLIWLNQLSPPYHLREGEYLYIPPRNDNTVVREGTVTLEYIREQRKKAELRDASPSRVTAKDLKAWAAEETPQEKPQPRNLSQDPAAGRDKERLLPQVAPSLGKSTFAWPVAGRYMRGFSDDWRQPHKGVDVGAAEGDPVYASREGRVLLTGNVGSYGLLAVVGHKGGFATLYAHLSESLVTEGKTVKQRECIGRVGSTGRSTGPHLHFEIRYNGTAVNPEKHLPKTELARK